MESQVSAPGRTDGRTGQVGAMVSPR
jgi:hypothetical protein